MSNVKAVLQSNPTVAFAAMIGCIGVKGELARRSAPLIPIQPNYTKIPCDARFSGHRVDDLM
jgi:hypothetical protein